MKNNLIFGEYGDKYFNCLENSSVSQYSLSGLYYKGTLTQYRKANNGTPSMQSQGNQHISKRYYKNISQNGGNPKNFRTQGNFHVEKAKQHHLCSQRKKFRDLASMHIEQSAQVDNLSVTKKHSNIADQNLQGSQSYNIFC